MTFFSFYGQPSCTPGPGGHPDGPHPEPQRHDHRGRGRLRATDRAAAFCGQGEWHWIV